jgi:hypothetical protein
LKVRSGSLIPDRLLGAGDVFVLNIADDLSLTGSASIGTIAQAGHTFVNLYDNSGTNLGLVAHIGDMINATTLIPYDSATFHSVNGAIWSGDGTITLMSNATVNQVPITITTPEPSSFMLLGAGLLSFGVAFRKRNSR